MADTSETSAEVLATDIRNLIVMDTQFGWRGSTELKHEEILRLEARGWVAEGDENCEYDLTDEGRAVISRALAARGGEADVETVARKLFESEQRSRSGEWTWGECSSIEREGWTEIAQAAIAILHPIPPAASQPSAPDADMSPGGTVDYYDVPDGELPGMWGRGDFVGPSAPEPAAAASDRFNRIASALLPYCPGNISVAQMTHAVIDAIDVEPAAADIGALCEGCPPVGYPTDKTRCLLCPRRAAADVEGLAEELDMMAAERFKVVPTSSGFWPYSVRAGDGEQELYKGHKRDCEIVARRMTGAFLDGADVAARHLSRPVVDEAMVESLRLTVEACNQPCFTEKGEREVSWAAVSWMQSKGPALVAALTAALEGRSDGK